MTLYSPRRRYNGTYTIRKECAGYMGVTGRTFPSFANAYHAAADRNVAKRAPQATAETPRQRGRRERKQSIGR